DHLRFHRSSVALAALRAPTTVEGSGSRCPGLEAAADPGPWSLIPGPWSLGRRLGGLGGVARADDGRRVRVQESGSRSNTFQIGPNRCGSASYTGFAAARLTETSQVCQTCEV